MESELNDYILECQVPRSGIDMVSFSFLPLAREYYHMTSFPEQVTKVYLKFTDTRLDMIGFPLYRSPYTFDVSYICD